MKLNDLKHKRNKTNPFIVPHYSTYIVPVLTYGSETLTLSKSDETLLAAVERKLLRRILGLVCMEGQLRSRYND